MISSLLAINQENRKHKKHICHNALAVIENMQPYNHTYEYICIFHRPCAQNVQFFAYLIKSFPYACLSIYQIINRKGKKIAGGRI